MYRLHVGLPTSLVATFRPVTESEISKISTVLISNLSLVLSPSGSSNNVHQSHSHNHEHRQPLFHSSNQPSPLFKKSTLDKDQLSNYRPIYNLSLISKIFERVVKSRLTDDLSSNNLLNPHQSAYVKHHSTKTALLYIHDHRLTENPVCVLMISLQPLTLLTAMFPSLVSITSLF